MTKKRSYQYYKQAFKDQAKPFAFVDLDFFDENVWKVAQRAGDKKIRVASKSVRCRALLQRILDYGPQYQGLMCYTAEEALWLSQEGFDDLLVAYPTMNPRTIGNVAEAVKQGGKIYLMTDKKEHLEAINEAGKAAQVVLPVCLDLDVSSRYLGLHFGVHRSSVTDLERVKMYYQQVQQLPFVALQGLMGYEAQIAGVGDQTKGQGIKNWLIKQLQQHSMKQVRQKRAEAVAYLEQQLGHPLLFVNGGGTGSLESTSAEAVVTEVTAGSAFFSPTLFDNYSGFQHLPAAAYAIEIVRQPQANIYTCLGGGYVASGMLGKDKIPQPYLPEGCQLNANEMAGEVQTPIHYTGAEQLALGDPILMRHSKAGELCERFNELLILQQDKLLGVFPTYRGEGKCFL
jgi:D-serine deaminase-like pyridoxal phosphate-dependent protein